MTKKLVISLGLTLLVSLGHFLFKPESVLGLTKTRTNEALVSASIGEGRLTVFGYTSPYAQVFLTGRNLREETGADSIGFFSFAGILFFKQEELYLITKDSKGRSSFPVSLPPFPQTITASVGPILLPPTVSLEKGVYAPDEQIIASGETIPSTDVTISLYRKQSKDLASRIVPPVNAYNLPRYEIKADKNGQFSFNLPASASTYRLFASTSYTGAPSPKSNTLTFQILSFWGYFFYRIKVGFTSLWALLKRFPILNVLIPIELGGLLFLIFYKRKVMERRLARKSESALVTRYKFQIQSTKS